MPTYVSYEITDQKPQLPGLPSAFDREHTAQTLILHCRDEVLQLDVDLYYTVFEENDMITRSVRISNQSKEAVYLTKAYSACLDMDDDAYEMLTLHGSWARERQMDRRPLGYGKTSVGSIRGESSHQEHPFMAWMKSSTTQTSGEVYAMHFIYSGNFIAQLEKSQFDSIRAVMGIHPADFSWKLESEESFYTPEAVLTFSAEGLGKMTRNFHDFYRNHLIRSKYRNQKRPILINNWEATYFDFNTQKLLDIAKLASQYGIEMLVMDDGWFGHRNDDSTSLGDWFVNEKKLPGGLRGLGEKLNAMGLQFGLWFEPESVSPDSELYRQHPDWALHDVLGREDLLGRHQLLLDLTKPEVRDYLVESVGGILDSAPICYVKWDMNRHSCALGAQQHAFVLGLYDVLRRILPTDSLDMPQLDSDRLVFDNSKPGDYELISLAGFTFGEQAFEANASLDAEGRLVRGDADTDAADDSASTIVPGPADPKPDSFELVYPRAVGVRMGICPFPVRDSYSYSSIAAALHAETEDRAAEARVPMDESGDDAESDGSEMTDADVAAVEPAGNPMALGSAFHAACQWLIEMGSDALPAERADALARLWRLTPEQRERFDVALDRWLESAVRADLLAWPCVRAEVPFFSLGCEDEDIARYGAYAEGAIDALATDPADPSRALVIDYKTGGTSDETPDQLLEKHALQARVYADVLHKAGFETVTVKFVRVEQANPAIFVEPAEPQVVTYNL